MFLPIAPFEGQVQPAKQVATDSDSRMWEPVPPLLPPIDVRELVVLFVNPTESQEREKNCGLSKPGGPAGCELDTLFGSLTKSQEREKAAFFQHSKDLKVRSDRDIGR